MSEDIFIRHCSPTLAGLKTGNLINCESTSEKEAVLFIRHLNKELENKGIRAVILRHTDDHALIYIYRPALLARDLNNKLARAILDRYDYPKGSLHACMMHLILRITENRGFPHEIGLFLGYPPRDVLAFIEGRQDCKCCGFWKVYSNEAAAKKTFARYRKCTEVYMRRWTEGYSLNKLTVAI